jgi:hypothetical protein
MNAACIGMMLFCFIPKSGDIVQKIIFLATSALFRRNLWITWPLPAMHGKSDIME